MGPTTPIQANQVKKGSFAILKERPCKIISVSISKTGKHGHAKCRFQGTDVFTGKTIEDVCPSTHNMEQPVLERDEFELIDIDDEGFLSLMGLGSDEMKEDMKLPEDDMGSQIQNCFDDGSVLQLTVLVWGDEQAVISFKKIEQ